MQDRDVKILAMRERGFTLQAIGDKFGMTRERARQVIKANEGVSAEQARATKHAERHAVIRQLAEGNPSVGIGDLLSLTGENRHHLRVALGDEEFGRRSHVRSAPNTWKEAQSDDEVLEALRRVSRRVAGRAFSTEEFDSLRDEGDVSAIRIIQRMGTWITACEAAGIDHHPPAHDKYVRRWSEADLLEWVAKFISTGDRPTCARYAEWARKTAGAPSATTVRNHLGDWTATREKAYALLG